MYHCDVHLNKLTGKEPSVYQEFNVNESKKVDRLEVISLGKNLTSSKVLITASLELSLVLTWIYENSTTTKCPPTENQRWKFPFQRGAKTIDGSSIYYLVIWDKKSSLSPTPRRPNACVRIESVDNSKRSVSTTAHLFSLTFTTSHQTIAIKHKSKLKRKSYFLETNTFDLCSPSPWNCCL